MIRPSHEQVREHFALGLGDICLVCDLRLVGHWTILHGEIKCNECGMTYQVISFKGSEERLAQFGLTKSQVARRHCPQFENVPIYRQYWQETHRQIPIGFYAIEQPCPPELRDSFLDWLADHAEQFRSEYEDLWKWDRLLSDRINSKT